jgi:hypothetical protein
LAKKAEKESILES